MKTYEYKYRKRGLPESEELVKTLEAKSFYEAGSKAAEQIGEEYVVTSIKMIKEEE